MDVIAGDTFYLSPAVYDGAALYSAGTVYVRIYDPATNKFWSTDGGGAWEAEGDIAAWPTATSKGHGNMTYLAPAGVSTGLTGSQLWCWMDDNDTPGSVTQSSQTIIVNVVSADVAREDDILTTSDLITQEIPNKCC